MVAMITATITPHMPVPQHPRSGIGVTPIKDIILRSPNAPFRGDQSFSNGQSAILRPLCGDVKPSSSHRTRPGGLQLLTKRCSSFKNRESLLAVTGRLAHIDTYGSRSE